ncbi:PadR family transcriptional regulator [Anaerosacchariphilus polymeriproducens]|uniref:PadR family transcriptional regulator n=1 Tax=Anaerosacchariphilus polymeriproducens TaxID=1812858 RepID=A0A371ASD0_9FIRM|nr:helix-turn-helix transcriptional regulator [Anaerosacchariphilus polymeriproducens]RDU22476.1 PadR family transcriptional regulator [Anaerosacchariphilus polymeriproducens]
MAEKMDRGALTEAVYYIMLSLFEPMHGYGIMQNVTNLSKGRVTLGPGTLYGAINTLLEKKWIQAVEGEKKSRKKEYIITQEGENMIDAELERLQELLDNGHRVVGRKEK